MRRIYIIFLWSLMVSVPAAAQDASTDFFRGFNSINAYHLDSFDSVNEDNFNLILHIPIVSYPQKGSIPDLSITVGYQPASWYWIEYSSAGGPYYKWYPVVAAGPYLYANTQYWFGTRRCTGGFSCSDHYIQGPDLSIHNLGATLTGGPNALDASGMQGTAINGLCCVYDRNGVSYLPNGIGGASDPSGNTITYDNYGNLIDTAGRRVPSPYWQPGQLPTSGCQTITYPGFNNGNYPVTFCVATYNISSSFGQSGIQEYSGTRTYLQSISLPNGTTWSFNYNSWGDISSIVTPTGGTVSYNWTSQASANPCGCEYERVLTSRTVNANDGAGGHTWTYGSVAPTGTVSPGVTDPDGNITALSNFVGVGATTVPKTRQYFQRLQNGSYALLKTVVTEYSYQTNPFNYIDNAASPMNFVATSVTTTWPTGQVSKTTTTYDSGATFYDPNSPPGGANSYPLVYGVVVQQQDFDYGSGGPGSLLRNTVTQYKWQSNSNYLNANLISQPVSVTIYDSANNTCKGQANPCAQTTYGYDENNGSPQGVFGNQTSVTRWLSGGTSPKTQYVYNGSGMRTRKCDPIDLPCANPTQYTYDATGIFLSQIQYPTTNGVTHTEGFGYDANTGLLVSHAGQNNEQTTYSYDTMRRYTGATYPPGGGTETITYNDGLPRPSFTFTRTINQGTNFVETGYVNGVGKQVQTVTTVPGTTCPSGSAYVDTSYDNELRKFSVSNPYCTTSDSTYGLTKTYYDVLNRVTSVVEQDNSTITTQYNGNCVTVSDEALHTRLSCTDGLQRLIEVDDHSAPTTSATPGSGPATVNGTEQSHYNAGGSFSAGPNGAGAGADGGGGFAVWANPGYITAADGLSAIARMHSTTWTTNALIATNFGFNLPSNTTSINGIQVDVLEGQSGWIYGGGVYIVKGGSPTGTDHDTGADWPAPSAAYVSYGNSTDLWGTSWSVSDINASNFGVAVYANNLDCGFENAWVDYIQITVWYTTADSTTYDSGTVWVNVNGVQISAPYGQYDSATSVANKLATAINTNCNGTCISPVTASLSGTNLTLTAKAAGSTTNYAFTTGSSWNSAVFAQPSFSVCIVSGSSCVTEGVLTGGYDIGGALTASTFYQYDAVNNLTRVDQKYDSNSADWRTRTFTYDSLSRLVCAANPEIAIASCPNPDNGSYTAGTIRYSYDGNSNVVSKTSPQPNQIGSATTTISYCYDALNRLLSKAYTLQLCPQSSPAATYGYDGIPPAICAVSMSATNVIGNRTGMCDAGGMEAWSYDQMGRTITDQRTTNSVTKATNYSYNFDGSVSTLTYPSQRTVTYTPNATGQSISAIDTTYNVSYATGATYYPSGALNSMANGTALVSDYFNARLQPCRFAVNTSGAAPGSCGDTNKGNVLDLAYNFGLGADNGNVLGITNNITPGRSLTAAYDALNRIESAYTSTWSEQYGIDLWGNLTTISAMPNKPAGENLSQSATTQNRLASMPYDAAGNMYNDGSTAYGFDAENRIASAGTIGYVYDGDGKRVAKSTSSGVYKIYWYGMSSDPLDETDGTGSLTNASFNEYVFFNGKRIARRNSAGTVFYYFADQLGTSREIVQAGQTLPCYDSDFYPFGRESNVYTNTCPQNYKFTGKERDETGLDNLGARYYSSQYGRFMIPDWNASPTAVPYASLPYPQSLNLYSYVQNNPVKSTDPNGHCTVDGEEHGWLWCFGHSLGLKETQKETATRERQEAEWNAFVKRHPEYRIDNLIRGPLINLFTMGALAAVGTPGSEDSTVTPEEDAAIDAAAAAGAEAGAARTMVNGVPQPSTSGEIVVGPNGAAVRIPPGYVAEPAANGNGIVYRPAGTTGDANTIRIMGPDAEGRYPNGYVRVYNSSGQPVVPSTGKPGTQANTHSAF